MLSHEYPAGRRGEETEDVVFGPCKKKWTKSRWSTSVQHTLTGESFQRKQRSEEEWIEQWCP